MTPCIVKNKNFENDLVLSLIVGQMIEQQKATFLILYDPFYPKKCIYFPLHIIHFPKFIDSTLKKFEGGKLIFEKIYLPDII